MNVATNNQVITICEGDLEIQIETDGHMVSSVKMGWTLCEERDEVVPLAECLQWVQDHLTAMKKGAENAGLQVAKTVWPTPKNRAFLPIANMRSGDQFDGMYQVGFFADTIRRGDWGFAKSLVLNDERIEEVAKYGICDAVLHWMYEQGRYRVEFWGLHGQYERVLFEVTDQVVDAWWGDPNRGVV